MRYQKSLCSLAIQPNTSCSRERNLATPKRCFTDLHRLDCVSLCFQSVELWAKVHQEAKQKLLPFMLDTTTVLKRATKYEEAYTTLEEARAILIAQKGDKDNEVQGLTVGLADLKIKQKKLEEALPLYQTALAVLQETNSPQEVQLLNLMIDLQQKLNNEAEVAKLKDALKAATAKHP